MRLKKEGILYKKKKFKQNLYRNSKYHTLIKPEYLQKNKLFISSLVIELSHHFILDGTEYHYLTSSWITFGQPINYTGYKKTGTNGIA